MAKRIKITETQVKRLLGENRVDFVKTKFDVFTPDPKEKKPQKNVTYIKVNNNIIAKITTEENNKKKIQPSDFAFNAIVEADPTAKKLYVQWMCQMFVNMIKENHMDEAQRLIGEDLPRLSDFITLFEKNKNTAVFKASAANNPEIPNPPTDITKYKSVDQLGLAVEPFREQADLGGAPSQGGGMGKMMAVAMQYVKKNEMEIVYSGPEWIVMIPKTEDAAKLKVDDSLAYLSMHMKGITTWCTAWKNNCQYNSYVSNYNRPGKEKAALYMIFKKAVLNGLEKPVAGQDGNLAQWHLESKQFMDKDDKGISNIYKFLSRETGMLEYFGKELHRLAKLKGGTLKQNEYAKLMLALGHKPEKLLEVIDQSSTILDLQGLGVSIPKLPDISVLKNTEQIMVNGIGLVELPKSLGNLPNLTLLTAGKNDIREVPKELANCRNLQYINLKDNPITVFPAKELAPLDPSNGGELFRITMNTANLPKETLADIKKYLPTVQIQ